MELSTNHLKYEDFEFDVEFVMDISGRKSSEDALVRSQKLESLGVLAGGIAHDFNNILAAIQGNISLASLTLDDKEDALRVIGNAEQACIRARDLTGQLLTFSKGGTPIKDLCDIASVLSESTNFALTGSKVKCVFDLEDNLPYVDIDKGQIHQVLQNIIINADQAMPGGGVINLKGETVSSDNIKDASLPGGNYVKITVEDQGIGISKDMINNIFDPFFTTKQKGSGLGLATSCSIIKNHGGEITVESTPGIGTTFSIYIPASDKSNAVNIRDGKHLVTGKGRILLMGDEFAIRILLEQLLRKLGYEVESAVDVEQVLEMYQSVLSDGAKYDAVILDLTVPGGMGGKEAMEQLLQIDPDVKAIVSSGYSHDPVMSEHKQYGFKTYIAKPFNVGTLSRILDAVITGKDF